MLALLVLFKTVAVIDVEHIAVCLVYHDIADMPIPQPDKLAHRTHDCQRASEVGNLELIHFGVFASEEHGIAQVSRFLLSLTDFFEQFLLLGDCKLFKVWLILVYHVHFNLLFLPGILSVVFD